MCVKHDGNAGDWRVARGSETHLVLRDYPIAGHAAGRCVRAMKSHSPLDWRPKGLWLRVR